MATIVTITFNPAIDKSTTVPLLIPEKKLNCSAPTYEPGGGGINVARAIKRLGGNATAIYLSGGYTGRTFTELLLKEEIDIISIKTEGLTRENLVVKEIASNQQFRFGMPGDPVAEKEWKNCIKALSKIPDVKYIVVSGSLPIGIPLDVFDSLSKIAQFKKARLIVDTSGAALKYAVTNGTFLIKPNLKELAMLVGATQLSIDQVEQASKEIISQYQCEAVVTSLGSEGAILTTVDGAYRITAPKVAVQSTVGAGDSMLAGITLSLSNNNSLIESAKYGVACGTAATMNQGTELCHINDVRNLYDQIVKNSQLKSIIK
ncbi:1-phosphofructokinase family hexose kinase [Pedobacter gandavensis]|uniref:1-phosphofructokinase family hexose kinase n=1 Tax=Pedobacter TaxID=84567 RepID=UPI001C997FB7|nr:MULTISPECIES: 1-phosphofructokinase family hexose kinase [Pedobacter]WGQ09848.1 1-phosphofructokinase family hexose kinase [Pedobacter gandavensis]